MRFLDVAPSLAALMVGAASLLAIPACGARSGLPIPEGTGGTSSSSSASSSSTHSSASTSTGGPTCAPGVDLVYVIATDDNLYRFNPPAKTFTLLGPVTCPSAPGMRANSMAVDRNGIAWVDYFDYSKKVGDLFRVATMNEVCTTSGVPLPSNWQFLGMGFTADPTGAGGEALFIANDTGQLGRVDFNTKTVTHVGDFGPPFTGARSELTGSSDGRLFALIDTGQPAIAEVDKSNAHILKVFDLAGLQGPFADFAFSYWGGAFYLYTTHVEGAGSTVARFDPTTGAFDPAYVPDAGFAIVGAGVAPCTGGP